MAIVRVLYESFERMPRLLPQKVYGRRERRMLLTTRSTSVSLPRSKAKKEWRRKLTSAKRSGAKRERNRPCSISVVQKI